MILLADGTFFGWVLAVVVIGGGIAYGLAEVAKNRAETRRNADVRAIRERLEEHDREKP